MTLHSKIIENYISDALRVEHEVSMCEKPPHELLKIIQQSQEQLKEAARCVRHDEHMSARSRMSKCIDNMQKSHAVREDILYRIDAETPHQTMSSYFEYRSAVRSLLTLMQKRLKYVRDMEHVDQGLLDASIENLTSKLATEGDLVVDLLMITSHSDGVIHKTEKRVIKRNYKKITSESLPRDAFDVALSGADNQAVIIDQLRSDAATTCSVVRSLMLEAAVEVAIADRQLHPKESELLIGVAQALDARSTTTNKPITDKQDIVAIIKRSRRVAG